MNPLEFVVQLYDAKDPEQELGVCNNFIVLARRRHSTLLADLEEQGYVLGRSKKSHVGEHVCTKTQFFTPDHLTELIVHDRISRMKTTHLIDGFSNEANAHADRQLQNYNCSITIHDQSLQHHNGGINTQSIIIANIAQIISYATQKGIPICFPQAVSPAIPKDYSKIMYYDP